MIFFTFLLLLQSAPLTQTPLTLNAIFQKPYLPGNRPENPSLSPDGKFLVFHWDESGSDTARLWIQNIDTGDRRLISASAGSRLVSWRPDGTTFLFLDKGDLWQGFTSGSPSTMITATHGSLSDVVEKPDMSALFLLDDQKLHSIQKDGPLFTSRLVKSDSGESVSLTGFSPAINGMVLQEWKSDSVRVNMVPHWLAPEVKTIPSRRYSHPVFRFLITRSDSSATVRWPSDGWISGYGGPAVVSPSGDFLAFSTITIDQKSRHLVLINLKSMQADTIFIHSDPAWINTFEGFAFSPDGQLLGFTHEMTGWNHLYTYHLKTKQVSTWTKGQWEVDSWLWNPAVKQEMVFTSTQDSPHQRHVYTVRAGSLPNKLTKDDAMRTGLRISNQGGKLVYLKASLTSPGELVVLNLKTGEEQVVTRTVPERLRTVRLTPPETISILNHETKQIFAAHRFLPPGYDRQKQYPAVVFVHGAGYLQNVTNEFGYYWREYLFNQFLASQGYVVLNIDYSGSAGYGRENRVSVFQDMGGPDWSDCVAAAHYLADSLSVDPGRIGIYGGSYGGFLTLMSLFKSPDVFKAGAALRSVANWKLYNRWYTEQRLGPQKYNQAIYEKTSPITYADSLKNHLLLLHGMVDDNVLVQDVIQLMDRLVQKKKPFDVQFYPAENHGFKDPDAWQHQYEAIFRHFERHLKNQFQTTSD
ncbi:MAG: alpha/beta fold hydrolase [Bacteroidetes bacterium]|nr:alpha/beta fold hydrolase [Bacteroidota bacterium]